MSDTMRTVLAALDADVVKPYPEISRLKALLTNVAQGYGGTVTGTVGVALDVATPGYPKFVIVVNTNTACFGIKIYGMATTNAIKVAATPAVSYAANMITLADDKFTIGTDANLNTTQTLVYTAYIG